MEAKHILSVAELANDFDSSPYKTDLQGWHSTDPVFQKLIEQKKPKIIIEVGSWKGASAIHMASLTKELGTNIICVDTWLGGVDHMLSDKPQDQIPKKHGYPQLYFQFLSNVLECGFADRIFPVINSSSNACHFLEAIGAKADLIYIDGSHEYQDVLLDILTYQKLLAPEGIMFGDDWAWPSVKKAVMDYMQKKCVKGYVDGEFWILK